MTISFTSDYKQKPMCKMLSIDKSQIKQTYLSTEDW